MIIGLGKKLENIRTILSNDINDIFVCQNIGDKNDGGYYTLIRIYNSSTIKDVLESIYNEDGTCNLPKSLFYGLFVEVDTLNILMKYQEPRKMFLYLKSYMNSDYEEHMIIKNFLYECLSLDVNYPILNLMLDKDNINLNENLDIYFNGFLDFSKFNKNISEEICVKKCCDLINDILLINEELTNKSRVKSIRLFMKKRRNNTYKKMIELYNDFKIKEKRYRNINTKHGVVNNIKLEITHIFENRLNKTITSISFLIIILAIIIFICNFFKLDLPFSKYKGMNIIGTVDMTER